MTTFNRGSLPQRIDTQYLDDLYRLLRQMDLKYAQAAQYYEFDCQGCRDNCCRSLFYHHTLLEYLYLWQGLESLPEDQIDKIIRRAHSVCRQTAQTDERAVRRLYMCPLNFAGLCSLYAYRPMICRLHGLPHEFKTAHRGIRSGPGCDTFTARCRNKKKFPFDRTPFYTRLAQLENRLRQSITFSQKIKMTVAQMISVRAPHNKKRQHTLHAS